MISTPGFFLVVALMPLSDLKNYYLRGLQARFGHHNKTFPWFLTGTFFNLMSSDFWNIIRLLNKTSLQEKGYSELQCIFLKIKPYLIVFLLVPCSSIQYMIRAFWVSIKIIHKSRRQYDFFLECTVVTVIFTATTVRLLKCSVFICKYSFYISCGFIPMQS